MGSLYQISRRDFCLSSLLAGLGALTSCASENSLPVLSFSKNTLPLALIEAFPKSWQLNQIEAEEATSLNQLLINDSDLLAIGDGWLREIPPSNIKKLDLSKMSYHFDTKANDFLLGLGQDFSNKVLPIGVSPWVMIFRNGDKWLEEAQYSWDVLLKPELENQIVFPESPRVLISISETINQSNSLRKLRLQSSIFDDRNALNWLLAGDAKVVILPLNRCWKSLIRDPRLSAILPKTGAPLDWTVLLQSYKSLSLFPYSWIEKSWDDNSLGTLMSNGWLPPLPYEKLKQTSFYVGDKLRTVLFPPFEVWTKCWSFSMLRDEEEKALIDLWNQSSSS